MNRIKNIFLLRHGESEGNVNRDVHIKLADHAIPLSERGKLQAREAAQKFLSVEVTSYFHGNAFKREMASGIRQLSVWTSPYLRTRQTTSEFLSVLSTSNIDIQSVQENIMLCEQQFGLFDGIPEEDLPILFPAEHAHYKKCEDFEGRFWARMPLGESRFDVAVRVHQMFGSLHRDADKYSRTNILISAHGVTIRAFVMQWLHLPFEWFDAEPNPKNCSIRHIQYSPRGYEDKGYVFEGF